MGLKEYLFGNIFLESLPCVKVDLPWNKKKFVCLRGKTKNYVQNVLETVQNAHPAPSGLSQWGVGGMDFFPWSCPSAAWVKQGQCFTLITLRNRVNLRNIKAVLPWGDEGGELDDFWSFMRWSEISALFTIWMLLLGLAARNPFLKHCWLFCVQIMLYFYQCLLLSLFPSFF